MVCTAGPRYRGYILDLDGTVYRGEQLLPGAAEKVRWIREHGRMVVFLSNKPLEPRSSYAAKLTRLGIPTAAEDVINSTQALLRYLHLHHEGAHIFVIGEDAMLAEIGAAGLSLTRNLEEIQVVVAAFDTTLTYEKLNIAHQALVRGAHFIATNADRTCPVGAGELPDCAGTIAFLEATTGRKLEVMVGKPSSYMLEAAAERLGVPIEDCLMVGDRLATDMVMAREADMDHALVLTGVTTPEALAQSEIRPTYVVASIGEIP